MASLAFIIGLAADSILRSKPFVASHQQPVPSQMPARYFGLSGAETLGVIRGQPILLAPRISQESVINVRGIGRLRICAHEDFGSAPKLVFTDATSGEELLSVPMGGYQWISREDVAVNPKLRFKIVTIKGFSSPLIIGVAINPGGSDSAWEAVAIGVVSGRLEALTYEHLTTSDEGGFFFGDLGHDVGFGAAQWDFVWGEDESHVSPHQYEIKLYKWNGWRFEWYKVFRTASHNSGQEALQAQGLHYVDIRKSFPEWSDREAW